MNTELERRKQEITRTQGRRKLWQRIVSALAAIVMFVTTYVLILPVEAQNRTFCEQEAHEHSAENGCYVETKTLKCEEKHEHTDECYITLLTLICQHEEHTHNKECYADKTADIETQQDWEASIKAAKLTGNWSEDILAIANTQLGYRESDKNYILGENNEIKGYTRYGDWIGDKYVDWSAAFVAFCVNYTGISKDEMTYDKAPEQWVELMKSAKQFNENISETNPGDIVFIDENGDNKADRVGIVVEQSEDKIKTVEGDLNNSVAYFEYELSAQTARTDVDSSNEESNNSAAAGTHMGGNKNSNNKDFSEEKSTTGRAARAEEKPNIIGSVSLPKNPDYVKPIDTIDPENPDATSEPGNRVNPTSSPDNRVTPTTPPNSNKEATRAANIPTLTGLAATTKVAVLFNGNTEEFTTLEDAMNFIDTAGSYEFTVVFVQHNTNDTAGWNAVATKGSGAKKISFTSIYNNGTEDITSTVTFAGNAFMYFSAETEFFNLDIKASGNNMLFMRGNKFTASEGITTTIDANNLLQIYGGNYNTPHPNATFTGNPDITILSGNWSYVLAGGISSATTANASIYIGGSAEIAQSVAAGGNGSTFTGDSVITVAGDAVVYMIAAGGWNSNLSGNVTVNLTERAQVTHAIHADFQANGNADSITYNLDGTDGAYVNKIYACPANSGAANAKTVYSINVKNMKDIMLLDTTSRNNGSGKVTIEGDCGVQYYFFTNTNTDVELAENATLQMGSNAELTQAGNAGEFRGQMQLNKSLIMNANSKLIMAGDSVNDANRIIKDIDVRGAGAEIDIYKRASTTYPIYITGEKLGNDKLKLGIFKAQDVDADDPAYGAILLTFSTEANAQEENHAPGAVTKGSTYEYDLDGVHKSEANIIVCKLLDEPIDITKGRLEFGNIYDDSDPNNPIRNAVQYTGDNTIIYAHDHSLKPKYSIMGNYATARNYPGIWVMPKTEVELFLMSNLTIDANRNACIIVTDTETTLTLQDMSASEKVVLTDDVSGGTQPHYMEGCIVKNGMTGTLTIRCEHAGEVDANGRKHLCDENICGKLDCLREGYRPDYYVGYKGLHAAGIGSSTCGTDPVYGIGFANLYIEGGIIYVPQGGHTAAIGTNCNPGNHDRYGNYVHQPDCAAVVHGDICKNINISGGRVYAFGGEYCSAIGSAIGTKVDGIYISGGAYVYAEGGFDAPAIGVGGFGTGNGYNSYWNGLASTEYEEINKFRNFVVTGGETVVVALGGQYSGGYVPGIGIGYLNDNGAYYGESSNIVATPDDGYMAVIQQGNGSVPGTLPFIPGAPSDSTLEVPMGPSIPNYGTLIYFIKLEKTASVNGAAEDTGTQNDPVMVNVGDTVKYIIRTGEMVDSNGAVSGSIVDELPEGMTFSGSGATPASGFSYSYDDSSKRYTVRWDNVDFSTAHEFSVNVTVNNLPAGVNEKTFENQAVLVHSDGTNDIPLNSNWTYHKVERQAPPEFDLTIEKTVVGAGTGPFRFSVTFTDASGDPVNIPAPAANSGYTVSGNVATFDLNKDGSVTITGIPVDTVATIVETSHNGYTVQYNFSDGTPSVSGDTAEVTITDDLTVTCINNAGFELPHTGGTGSLILTLGGVILVATALMYGISAKRRQWRAWI